jgi:hypothetical protein
MTMWGIQPLSSIPGKTSANVICPEEREEKRIRNPLSRCFLFNVASPPSPPEAFVSEQKRLFENAGFVTIETSSIDIVSDFRDFDDDWNPFLWG